jgi:hypothetical protein
MKLDNVIGFLVFGVIAGLVAVGFAVSTLYESRRRTAVSQIAEQLGLAYSDDGTSLLAELDHLPLFSRGRAKRISNLVLGDTDEVAMGIFDYRYTTGSGKNSQTHRQTVAYFRAPDAHFPQFELKPQHFLHAVGKLFGYQDIDFASHPKFSKSFVLRGTNETAVRKLFAPALLEFFETKSQMNVEGQGQHLIVYRPSKRVKPEQLKNLMREGFDVFAQVRAAQNASGSTLTT